MRAVEAEGASIDEAIEHALGALRVRREQVEIEILENAARGLFGLGSRRARVRATVRAALDPRQVDGPGASRTQDVSRETESESTARSHGATALRARDVLDVILGHLDDSPRVEIADGDETGTIQLSLSGRDSGLLIGRRGETLDALEHLVRRIIFRDEVAPGIRISLDVEGYRNRRQESLEQLARKLASKVAASGSAVTMTPMSPRDRRIVHLALQSDSNVATVSEGEGIYRRLVIFPKDGRDSRPRQG